MAWSATLQNVSKDAGTGVVSIVIRLSDGTTNWDKTYTHDDDDLQMTMPNLRAKMRDLLDKKMEFKQNYQAIKALEGQQIL